ncbi:lipase family protein [Aureliella helgolandensis]|uniref:Alpha/beta hydrolase family protein n=1 Tax=Aureliella helgolandensis TaxID=2527968 RepID=A0A518G9L6_9BACT|nr:hypothetical protein [Aureliella helgolandensis]QDV25287.1 hypothetical protein Q31a_36110 [Aureliella helgolandensis]
MNCNDTLAETHIEEVVVLVHGIRTFANWQPLVVRILEEIPGIKVVPIKYGYLDAIRFWCPFTRSGPIDDVRREVQNARRKHPNAQLSVIAHSFGTYAITSLLRDNPDLHLNRLLLSGSIVSRSFRWDYVDGRLAHDVINDYGTRDVWPVLAKCLSWGYGDTGRHGFGRAASVRDRGHAYSHSDFFNEAFVRTYWKPWFEEGRFVTSEWEESSPPSPWLLSVLSVFPAKWLTIIALLTGVYLICTQLRLGSATTQLSDSPQHGGDRHEVVAPSEAATEGQNDAVLSRLVQVYRPQWTGIGSADDVHGNTYNYARIFDPQEQSPREWKADACVLTFELEKHTAIPWVRITDVSVIVHDYERPPDYRRAVFAGAESAHVFYVLIDDPEQSGTDTFSAVLLDEHDRPSATKLVRLEEELPDVIYLRINAARPGLYTISCQVTVSYQSTEILIPLMKPTLFLFGQD